MRTNTIFRDLIRYGIRSVAHKTGRPLGIIREEIGHLTVYSVHTVRHWERGNIPNPEIVAKIVKYCVANGSVDRRWASQILRCVDYLEPDAFLAPLFPEKSRNQRILICYSRRQAMDRWLAISLIEPLSANNIVSIDQDALAQSNQSQLEAQLRSAALIVVLLSPGSVGSELLEWELESYHRLREENKTQAISLVVFLESPILLPTRLVKALRFAERTFWRDSQDTPRLINEIEQVMQKGRLQNELSLATFMNQTPRERNRDSTRIPTPSPISIRRLAGTLEPQSSYYIQRPCDEILLASLRAWPATISIIGPRQIGKSSLLNQAMLFAEEYNYAVAEIDLQSFQSDLDSTEEFLLHFCSQITSELEIDDQISQYWDGSQSNYRLEQRCTQYLEKYVLPTAARPILLAIDETEILLNNELGSIFFGMLRSWHNRRARRAIFKKLGIVLVTSTEPYAFNLNLFQSPFNVSTEIRIHDFSADQMQSLSQRYGLSLSTIENEMLAQLLNGLPYLTQLAFYHLAIKNYDVKGLLTDAVNEDGPFGDHLRSLRLRFLSYTDLTNGLKQLLFESKDIDTVMASRLESAGLISIDDYRIQIRCQLYEAYLKRALCE